MAVGLFFHVVLSTRPTKPYLTTWPSHSITEKLIFQIGHPPNRLPPCSRIQVEQQGIGTMRIVCKFRNSCPEVLCENSSSQNFGTFSGKHSCWGPILINLQNEELQLY